MDDEKLSDEFMDQLRTKWKFVQGKINACDIHITVNEQLVPLRDCDWVLLTPCGCAVTIMTAVTGYETYPDAESAWHEVYDMDPHPHKRVRDAAIRKMKNDGYTMVAMLRSDAIAAHRKVCGHSLKNGRQVDTAGSVDDYPPSDVAGDDDDA